MKKKTTRSLQFIKTNVSKLTSKVILGGNNASTATCEDPYAKTRTGVDCDISIDTVYSDVSCTL